MTRRLKTALLAGFAGIGLMAAGCADERGFERDARQSADFGRAVQEDLAAQIADPDAVYKGPMPPSDGARAALAQKRYKTDTVLVPLGTSTSSVSGGSSGGGGGGGGGQSGGGQGGSQGSGSPQ